MVFNGFSLLEAIPSPVGQCSKGPSGCRAFEVGVLLALTFSLKGRSSRKQYIIARASIRSSQVALQRCLRANHANPSSQEPDPNGSSRLGPKRPSPASVWILKTPCVTESCRGFKLED